MIGLSKVNSLLTDLNINLKIFLCDWGLQAKKPTDCSWWKSRINWFQSYIRISSYLLMSSDFRITYRIFQVPHICIASWKYQKHQRIYIAKLSPSPSSSLRLRWLHFQLSLPPTNPATQPPIWPSLNLASDNIITKSKVSYLLELGLWILSPMIVDLDQHQA